MSARADQVRALYEGTLMPRIDSLEAMRREVRGYVVKSAALIGIPLLIAFLGPELVSDSMDATVSIAGMVLMFAGVVVAGFRYALPGFTAHANYRARFKRQVVAEIVSLVAPGVEYEPLKGIAREVFDEPGLFNTRGGYMSDDRVRGRIGRTPFEAADVSRHYRTRSSSSPSKGTTNSTRHTVFHGLFFHLDFNRSLRGRTIIEPRSASHSQLGDRASLQLVALGDAEFEKEFKVYTDDEVETRELLTPAMMTQVLAVRQQAEHPVFLAFKGTRAYIGIHYNRPAFEPRIAGSPSLEAVQQIATQFALPETIVNTLDLNRRTTDRDHSPLWQPGEVTTPFEAAAGSGHLSVEQLWEFAAAKVGADNPEAETSLPRPDGTSIDVQHEADGARVWYGLSFGFFFCIAVTLAGLVIAAAAIRSIGQGTNLGPLASLAARVPPIPQLDQLVAGSALGWLGASLLVSGIFALGWVTRVHRVVITPEAVLISRGIRPFPRRYSRPPFGRIIRIDKVVYLGKVDSTGLMNPSASPVLESEEEARWLAAEMRRAVQQTSRR